MVNIDRNIDLSGSLRKPVAVPHGWQPTKRLGFEQSCFFLPITSTLRNHNYAISSPRQG